MSTQLVPVQDIERMALAVANSRLFGMDTPDKAMALMLIAQAEGLHPAVAARDFHIIQGRPTLKADAILARFQAAGGTMRWIEYTDTRVSAEFSHPAGGKIEIAWDMDRAKKAGLGGKDMWTKYPRQMLAARCISEGVKRVYPGATNGMYTPEEAEDMPPLVTAPPPERVIVGERVEDARPVVGRVQLEGEIDRATTLDALDDLVPLIQQLQPADRDALRARYAAQKRLIKQAAAREEKEAADNWLGPDPQEAA